MAKFITKTVTIDGVKRKTDDVITELWNISTSRTKERAYPILASLQQQIHHDDKELNAECSKILTYLSAPSSSLPENKYETAGNDSNMSVIPDNDYIPYDENVKSKTSHPPRRFVIADNCKEKMLQFIHLAWRNKWFITRNEDGTGKLSQSDVYYWFGRLLGYDFNKRTSMLSQLYNKERRKALAQEIFELALEVRNMTDDYKNSIDNLNNC